MFHAVIDFESLDHFPKYQCDRCSLLFIELACPKVVVSSTRLWIPMESHAVICAFCGAS